MNVPRLVMTSMTSSRIHLLTESYEGRRDIAPLLLPRKHENETIRRNHCE